jgi:tetratricopeptide (TPR) repeat protein/tRNA A-37 threonylcarbamoyl transferase component Bud32
MPEPRPNAAADRNLLFGILALQADLISRDALIGAMSAWAVHKVTPLGQVLRDQGALTAEGHALVEALVRLSLARHGDDAEQSLAALSSLGSARQALAQIADAELHASLAHVSAAAAAEQATTVGRPTSAGQRFRILRPHAKGGLGEVFVARDEELHREVALKEIQPRHADQPDSRARFLLEAEITGGLEHPGIVPVYGLGHYDDGRPFYAMRFVRGDSLKDAITRFHRADVPGRDLGERTLALRELLGRFIDVCNAIAYAHSRGVLHRDLKPGNVMLGRYGETLVVDRGLAKAVGRSEGAPDTAEGTLRPTAASDSAPTQLGTAIGTPAYMAPEQAAGRLDRLGPASDVYSLGATLYCLLTGRAPFTKDDGGAVLQKVQRGEFAPPRQVKGSVPPALEAICLKAMAMRPQERYPSPQALADDLEHWLADEPVRAYREPLGARLGRWRRRHRVLVTGLTVALVVAALLTGSWLAWRAVERAEAVTAADDALAEAERRARNAQWGEARALALRGLDLLERSGGDERRLSRARHLLTDLALIERVEEIRLELATWVEGSFAIGEADQNYARAFRSAGLAREGEDPVDVARRVQASALRGQLVAAVDNWLFVASRRARRDWLLAVARRVDPGRWRNRLRDLAAWRDRAALQRLADEAQVRVGRLSPALLAAAGCQMPLLGVDAVPLLRAAQQHYPGDFWLNFLLGHALMIANRPGEAIGYYRAALVLRPKASAVHNNLGIALREKGELDAAIACYHQALALDSRLVQAHMNLGHALKDKDQLEEAIACYHKALQLDPRHTHAHIALGLALQGKGRLKEAIACYQKALALDPRSAAAHTNLGSALQEQGHLDQAIACHRKAIACFRKGIEFESRIAVAHNNLGIALKARGQLDQAIGCFQKALAIDPKYVPAHAAFGTALHDKGQLDRASACYRKAIALDPRLAPAHYNLGNILKDQGQWDAAIACYRKAIEADPTFAQAHTSLGDALSAQGKLAQAMACYRKALALDPKYAPAHYNLGNVLKAQGRLDQAIECYRKALEVAPRSAQAHTNLGIAQAHTNMGIALYQQGQRDQAIACYQKAIALDPKLAEPYIHLGLHHYAQKQFDEAIVCYRKGLEHDPKRAAGHCNLGLAYSSRGQVGEAVACFRRAVALDPRYVKGHAALGSARLRQGRFSEARDSTRRALQLLPARHQLYPVVSQQLRQCERFLVLDAKLPALLQGKDRPTSAAEGLEYAALCHHKKRYTASARFFSAAFATNPKLAEDPVAGHRYAAACVAALAGGGQGRDAPLSAQERGSWRQQALDWLRADLTVWTKHLEQGTPQARTTLQPSLQHWRRNGALAVLREEAVLAWLPQKERQACRQFWADVDALLQRAGSPK